MRQLKQIVFAVLCIPDRVTMLSIARWTERGGSYRTVQRWYHTPVGLGDDVVDDCPESICSIQTESICWQVTKW